MPLREACNLIDRFSEDGFVTFTAIGSAYPTKGDYIE